jgi:hypothetical protein
MKDDDHRRRHVLRSNLQVRMVGRRWRDGWEMEAFGVVERDFV